MYVYILDTEYLDPAFRDCEDPHPWFHIQSEPAIGDDGVYESMYEEQFEVATRPTLKYTAYFLLFVHVGGIVLPLGLHFGSEYVSDLAVTLFFRYIFPL